MLYLSRGGVGEGKDVYIVYLKIKMLSMFIITTRIDPALPITGIKNII